jgi:transposase
MGNRVVWVNTKWDASNWSREMKIKWHNKMFEYGFSWEGSKNISCLDYDFYLVSDFGVKGIFDDRVRFNCNRCFKQEYTDLFEAKQIELTYGDECYINNGKYKGKDCIWLCKDPREKKGGQRVVMDKSTGDIYKVFAVQIEKALTQEEKDSIVKSKLEKVLLEMDAVTIAEKLFHKGITEEDLWSFG